LTVIDAPSERLAIEATISDELLVKNIEQTSVPRQTTVHKIAPIDPDARQTFVKVVVISRSLGVLINCPEDRNLVQGALNRRLNSVSPDSNSSAHILMGKSDWYKQLIAG
jgi:hypothetical protein